MIMPSVVVVVQMLCFFSLLHFFLYAHPFDSFGDTQRCFSFFAQLLAEENILIISVGTTWTLSSVTFLYLDVYKRTKTKFCGFAAIWGCTSLTLLPSADYVKLMLTFLMLIKRFRHRRLEVWRNFFASMFWIFFRQCASNCGGNIIPAFARKSTDSSAVRVCWCRKERKEIREVGTTT